MFPFPVPPFKGPTLGDVNSISTAIVQKIDALERVGERLKYLTSHDSLVILHKSLAIPKLQYLLHTSPCFKSSTLQHYDDNIEVHCEQCCQPPYL